MTALRIAPALVVGALAVALPASAAPPRHYILTGQNGSATFSWSVTGGVLRGSNGKAEVKFVGLGGTGILDVGLGGGSTGGPLRVTRNETATVCGKGKVCVSNPVCPKGLQSKQEGGVSFKVDGKSVKVTPNFPVPVSVCALSRLAKRTKVFEDLEKAGLLTMPVPLSRFAQKTFVLKLHGSVPIKELLPGGAGQMNGTYAWQFTVILERS